MTAAKESWFTVEQVDPDTYIISEYRHWEETHCYLLRGGERSLLIDTGLGICDISRVVAPLAHGPVTAVVTHVHWDHMGGLRYYPDFYAHAAELSWLNGGFPQPVEAVRRSVADRCQLPQGFDVGTYQLFQGTPTQMLHGGETIHLGGRELQVLHTPGHSPGHMCFWERERGYLFTGDLIYRGELAAWFPSTDPQAYLASLERVAKLPVQRLFPGHHDLDVSPTLGVEMRDGLEHLREMGKLHHGAGRFQYHGWSIRL